MATAKAFPLYIQESILGIVKSSHDAIDSLVEKIEYRLKNSLIVGDKVNFTADDKVMKGEVMVIHRRPTPIKINLVNECNGSPSSDKENDFVSTEQSNAEAYKYSVKIDGKTVCSIPAQALARTSKLPSRDSIKAFILSKSTYTVDNGKSSASWTVKEAVKKRKASSTPHGSNKKSKLADKASKSKTLTQQRTLDAFVKVRRVSADGSSKVNSRDSTPAKAADKLNGMKKTPTKASGQQKPSTPQTSKPRKLPSTPKTRKSPAKSSASKAEAARSPRCKTPVMNTPKVMGSPRGASPRTRSTPCFIDLSNDKVKNRTKPSNTKPLVTSKSNANGMNKKAKKTTPSKPKVNGPKSSDKAVVMLEDTSKLATSTNQKPTTAVSVMMGKPVQIGAGNASGPIPVVMKQTVIDAQGNTKVQYKQGHLAEVSKSYASKAGSGGMKQLTLFDLAKSKSADGSFDGFASVVPPTPKVVRKYRKAVKDDNDKVQKQCILIAAKEMNEQQRDLLPTPMKSRVKEKMEFLQLRLKLKDMTEEEKKIYIKKKRAEYMANRPKRTPLTKPEDLLVVGSKDLPAPDLVTLPEGVPISSLDDLMFVSEFLISFQAYLIKPETVQYNHLTFDTLANYIVSKEGKLHEVLGSMLQSLLADFTLSDAFELGVPLKGVAVNRNTLSNLLYLTFKLTGQKEERSAGERLQLINLAAKIEGVSDVVELSSIVLLECLTTLCSLLLDGQEILNYQEDTRKKLAKALNERHNFWKAHADFVREHGVEDLSANNNSRCSTPNLIEEGLAQPQSLNDVLKLRREMSKKSAEDREKKQAEEKKQKQVAAERAQLENRKQVVLDKVEAATLVVNLSKRLTPLGMDRFHNRYWMLPRHQGLFVEKGWTHGDYYYNVNNSAVSNVSTVTVDEVDPHLEQVPKSCPHAWFQYKDKASVDGLLGTLNERGFREENLLTKIKSNYSLITTVVKPGASASEDTESDEQLSPIDSFKEDLLELEDRIRCAGLGGIDKYDAWTSSLEQAFSTATLGCCLLECQAGVYENRRCGVMGSAKLKKKTVVQPSENDDSDEAIDVEKNDDDKVVSEVPYLKRWKDSVGCAQTISRLYVLMEIFDMCVAWDKSVDNAKCRVCKRKGNDATLLLCDGCDLGFHMACLRLTKKDVPEGDWFCPSCKPPEIRKSRNSRSLKDVSDSEDEDDSEDDSEEESSSEEEEICTVCNKGGDVALCDTCLSAYHVACHQPPLRAVPRLVWTCHSCRFGTHMKKKKRSLNSSLDTESQTTETSTERLSKPSTNGKDRSSRGERNAISDLTVRVEKLKNNRTMKSLNTANEDEVKPSRQRAARKVVKSAKESEPETVSDSDEEPAQNSMRSRARNQKPAVSKQSKNQQSRRRRTRLGDKFMDNSGSEEEDTNEFEEKSESESEEEPALKRTRAAPRKQESSVNKRPSSKLRPARGSKVQDAKQSKKSDSQSSVNSSTRRSPRQQPDETAHQDSASDGDTELSDAETEDETDEDIELNLSQEQREIVKLISPAKKVSKRLAGKEGKVQLILADCSGAKNDKSIKESSNAMSSEQLTQKLKTIHSKLWAHRSSWPFDNAVDAAEVPDYYDVISKPMDLTTMLDKIDEYKTVAEFVEDVRQMIFNSFDYNEKDSKIATIGVAFEDYFVKMLAKYLPDHAEYKKQQTLFGLGVKG